MKILKIFLLLFFLPLTGYSQSSLYRDPFESLLPEERVDSIEEPKVRESSYSPSVTVKGIFWGTNAPKAIIDGEVYAVGDTLKDINAKVFKIEKSSVFLLFREKIYEMKVTTAKNAEKR